MMAVRWSERVRIFFPKQVSASLKHLPPGSCCQTYHVRLSLSLSSSRTSFALFVPPTRYLGRAHPHAWRVLDGLEEPTLTKILDQCHSNDVYT